MSLRDTWLQMEVVIKMAVLNRMKIRKTQISGLSTIRISVYCPTNGSDMSSDKQKLYEHCSTNYQVGVSSIIKTKKRRASVIPWNILATMDTQSSNILLKNFCIRLFDASWILKYNTTNRQNKTNSFFLYIRSGKLEFPTETA